MLALHVHRMFFIPVGGVAALVLSTMAIVIGSRCRGAIDTLPEPMRSRAGNFIDLERERKRATTGMALGIAGIVINPFIVFLILALTFE